MNRQNYLYYFIANHKIFARFKCLFFLAIFLLLNGCGGNSVNKPNILIDVEAYTNNGIQAYTNAEWGAAQSFFDKALQLYQGIDYQKGVLLSYINLAEVSLAQHNYDKSHEYLTYATAIAKYDSFQRYRSRITLLYGLIALQQKKLTEAEHILQNILPAFNDDHLVVMPTVIQLSALASQTKIAFLKKQDEALWTRRYENALKKAENKNTDREARLFRFQSSLLLQQGFENEAELKMKQALFLYKENLSRVGIAITLLELAQFYQMKQRWQEAQDYLNRSKVVYNFLGNDEKIKLITELLTQVSTKMNR